MNSLSSVTDITIIIPSLNPDNKLRTVIDEVLDRGFKDIIVVDDGSDEEHRAPFAYAREKGCTVLVHEINRGKGRALKTAFSYCLKRGSCIGAITVDGDGQHKAIDMYRCGEEMLREGNKVILGVRDFSSKNVPFKSKWGNNITRFAFLTLCGIRISDTQTGLRAIPAEYLKNMTEYKGERFEYETNMLLEMKTQGIGFSEIKISTVYIEENASSHFNPLRDSLKIYRVIFKYSLSAGISTVIDMLMFYCLLYIAANLGVRETLSVYVATGGARIISAICNYTLNQRVVFKTASRSSLVKYSVLCAVQMLVSASLVAGAATLLRAGEEGKLFIKMVVDTCLFFVSFNIQREWVFKLKK